MSSTTKLLTADHILRDYKILRGIYDEDARFRARIDAAVLNQNTAADRAIWAQHLGIGTDAGPREILTALAGRLGIKRAGRQPVAAAPRAKPAVKAVKKAGGKRGRQAADTSALQAQILATLKSGAMTSEALRKKLGAEKPVYKKAADALVAGKKIKKSGERRNTEFRLA